MSITQQHNNSGIGINQFKLANCSQVVNSAAFHRNYGWIQWIAYYRANRKLATER